MHQLNNLAELAPTISALVHELQKSVVHRRSSLAVVANPLPHSASPIRDG